MNWGEDEEKEEMGKQGLRLQLYLYCGKVIQLYIQKQNKQHCNVKLAPTIKLDNVSIKLKGKVCDTWCFGWGMEYGNIVGGNGTSNWIGIEILYA